MYQYAEQNLVKMWWGTNPSALEDQGWYYCDGRTLDSTIFGSVTLPDLRNVYQKSSSTDYDGTLHNHRTDVNQWDISVANTQHTHRFRFGVNSVSNNNSHGSTNSTTSNNSHKRNDNTYNESLSYRAMNTRSYSNVERGDRSDAQATGVHLNDSIATTATTNTEPHHRHNLSLSMGSWTNGIDDGDHIHNFSGFDAETRPSTYILHPLMFLGPLET